MNTKPYSEAHSEVLRTIKEGSRIGYALGAFLGFPSCCIKFFLESTLMRLKEQHIKLIDHPLKGTGFVPCDHCIGLEPEVLVASINANRTFTKPFPYKGGILEAEESQFEEFRKHYTIPIISS